MSFWTVLVIRHPKPCCSRSHQNDLCNNTIADQEKVHRHTYIATFFHHSLNAAEKLREIQMKIGTEEKTNPRHRNT